MENGWLRLVLGEPRSRVRPERIAGPHADLLQQRDHVVVVAERRLATAQRIERPEAGVERGQQLRGRGLERGGEVRSVLDAAELGVLLQREDALQLGVEDDGVAEPVELAPQALGQAAHETRDEAVGGVRRVEQGRVTELARDARERLRGDGLRHPGRPGRLAAAERELVLPAERPSDRHGACDERARELRGLVETAGTDLVVEQREVAERVEDKAVAVEPPVEDAVAADRVRPGPRDAVGLEVRDVLVELREERERSRARVGARLGGHVREHARDRLGAKRRQGGRD